MATEQELASSTADVEVPLTEIAHLDLLPRDDPEVAWRLEAMAPQVPSDGPVPLLKAKACEWESGECYSCGEQLAEGDRWCCRPCRSAAWLAIYGDTVMVPAEEVAEG